MNSQTRTITAMLVDFVESLDRSRLPDEAVRIGRRCMLDTLGLYVAGATEPAVGILVAEALDQGGRADALLLGGQGVRVPAPLAARVLATSGHAHDWDDTQVSEDPSHMYGLLTHPSVPPLTAALCVAQTLESVSGRDLMLAFQTGFEVECKISEWMTPDHYRRGHHSSGTVGTFGACAAASKLLGLRGRELAHAFGIAASLAAGIRCNFGTMTKPLHVGRAAENGITAALLARRGFAADPEALDGRWGFMQVLGGGHTPDKLANGVGNPLNIVAPGVSIKPYPSGILTHQSMDAMLALVCEHDLQPEEVERIRFHAGSNILDPIRYPIAANHLQAKFSMQALLSMIVLRRQAGPNEFTDAFVGGEAMQAMQRRIETVRDAEIESMGFELIRSRIEVVTRDGRTLTRDADTRYRGGPAKPMTDGELEDKFRVCCEDRLGRADQDRLIAAIWSVDDLPSVVPLVEPLAGLAVGGY